MVRAHLHALALCLAAAASPVGAAGPAVPPPPAAALPATTAWDLELVPLKPGIFLLRRPDVLRQPVEPNALVIVNDEDVVVVDAGGTPLAAENAIRLVRSVTTRPISLLVNTHWHPDHTFGNATWRAAFPGLLVVGHPNTRRDVLGAQARYLGKLEAQLAPAVRELAGRVERGEATERQRRLLADLTLAIAEAGRTTVSAPDLTVADGLVLHRGGREIEVRFLGPGNTEGDLVVWLPRERVLATGDLVVAPIPYGFGSSPRGWIDALDRVAAFDFELLVPGHGEVQRDRDHVHTLQAMLREARTQMAAAVARGLDLEAARRALDLSAFERQIAGDDPYRKALFEGWWRQPIGRSAWLEAKGLPIVQGASDETG